MRWGLWRGWNRQSPARSLSHFSLAAGLPGPAMTLAPRRSGGRRLRIWSAITACSPGEQVSCATRKHRCQEILGKALVIRGRRACAAERESPRARMPLAAVSRPAQAREPSGGGSVDGLVVHAPQAFPAAPVGVLALPGDVPAQG